jgi:dihydrofolate reductase
VEVAKLIYAPIGSLDGYIEDEDGRFGWAMPDDEVYSFVNDLIRPIGTYLYGRRMYETMLFWETAHNVPDQPYVIQDFSEIWQAADKIVYSKSLDAVSSARTRIERDLDPEAIRHLKATAAADITVGGAELAAQAFRAGLVDELRLFLVPVVVGAGKPALPDQIRLDLQLLDERRFKSDVTYLRYGVKSW